MNETKLKLNPGVKSDILSDLKIENNDAGNGPFEPEEEDKFFGIKSPTEVTVKDLDFISDIDTISNLTRGTGTGKRMSRKERIQRRKTEAMNKIDEEN